MTETHISIGARVCLNDLGKTKTRMKSDRGTVVSRTKGNGFYVLMDGNKTPTILHRTYIDLEDNA
jgi:hypothetical protein